MDETEALTLMQALPHWHQRYEIFPGVITPGAYSPDFIWQKIQLKESVLGREVLDIGACDGFFSREFHKLGAKVTAVDYKSKNLTGFSIMERCYGHEIEHNHVNLYDAPGKLQRSFDVVVCLGVLYHLPDMMRALAAIRQLCREHLVLETYVETFAESNDMPLSRYYQGASLAGDDTNFWAPNGACVAAMLADAGFEVWRTVTWGDRMLVQAGIDRSPSSLAKLTKAYGRLDLSGVV